MSYLLEDPEELLPWRMLGELELLGSGDTRIQRLQQIVDHLVLRLIGGCDGTQTLCFKLARLLREEVPDLSGRLLQDAALSTLSSRRIESPLDCSPTYLLDHTGHLPTGGEELSSIAFSSLLSFPEVCPRSRYLPEEGIRDLATSRFLSSQARKEILLNEEPQTTGSAGTESARLAAEVLEYVEDIRHVPPHPF